MPSSKREKPKMQLASEKLFAVSLLVPVVLCFVVGKTDLSPWLCLVGIPLGVCGLTLRIVGNVGSRLNQFGVAVFGIWLVIAVSLAGVMVGSGEQNQRRYKTFLQEPESPPLHTSPTTK